MEDGKPRCGHGRALGGADLRAFVREGSSRSEWISAPHPQAPTGAASLVDVAPTSRGGAHRERLGLRRGRLPARDRCIDGGLAHQRGAPKPRPRAGRPAVARARTAGRLASRGWDPPCEPTWDRRAPAGRAHPLGTRCRQALGRWMLESGHRIRAMPGRADDREPAGVGLPYATCWFALRARSPRRAPCSRTRAHGRGVSVTLKRVVRSGRISRSADHG